ncbi:unnamed protein product [Periconia digitata]|uniref:Uncharacterized protein n=1 Tax=Periconia digitata TaxID=1303443 RepID=A0A9W4XYY5_9PLEO|nr:unnamed protein product [Periconia digitata]
MGEKGSRWMHLICARDANSHFREQQTASIGFFPVQCCLGIRTSKAMPSLPSLHLGLLHILSVQPLTPLLPLPAIFQNLHPQTQHINQKQRHQNPPPSHHTCDLSRNQITLSCICQRKLQHCLEPRLRRPFVRRVRDI